MTQRRIGDDDRLEAFFSELVANGDDVGDARRLAFGRGRDVRSVDENDVPRPLTLRMRLHTHGRDFLRARFAESLAASFAAESAAAVESAMANLVCRARARP